MSGKTHGNIVRNSIKTLCLDDDKITPMAQVSSFGETKNVGKIGAYGFYGNAPKGSLVTIMQINGQEECLGGFEDDVNNRPRALKEGEVMVYNTLTKSYFFLKENNDVAIFAGTGNVTIECNSAIVKANTVALGEGGKPIARLGDEVTVTVPTHGDCVGTITKASTKNTSA